MTDPETPHRATKDRRHWCKGKQGTPHKEALRRRVYGRDVHEPCHYWPCWRKGRIFTGYQWRCHHQQFCHNCGKVLKRSISRPNCPDFIARGNPEPPTLYPPETKP